jgi:hypothetical protein
MPPVDGALTEKTVCSLTWVLPGLKLKILRFAYTVDLNVLYGYQNTDYFFTQHKVTDFITEVECVYCAVRAGAAITGLLIKARYFQYCIETKLLMI